MKRTSRSLTAALLGIAALLAGCIKPNTFDPYEPPRHVRRLQFLERMGSCQVVHRGGTRRSCV
ncbi:hypothetical protein BA03_03935, partial [Mycobacterium tuberculosis NRITLD44]